MMEMVKSYVFAVCLLWLGTSGLAMGVISNDDNIKLRLEWLEEKYLKQDAIISRQSHEIEEQKKLIDRQQSQIDELKQLNKYHMESQIHGNSLSLQKRLKSQGISQAKRFVVDTWGPIAFHARINQGAIEHIGVNQKLIFETVMFNKGNGYHASTGLFIAPVSGVYFFSLSVCIQQNGKLIHAEIMKNGAKVAGAYARDYDQGSVSVILPLAANDEVWVSSLYRPDTSLWGSTLTSFIGFKMSDL